MLEDVKIVEMYSSGRELEVIIYKTKLSFFNG